MSRIATLIAGMTLAVLYNQSADASQVLGKTQGLNRTLMSALHTMSRQTGRPVEVISGCRSHGRRHSYHRTCQAADVRIPGLRPTTVRAVARQIPTLGGIGIYSSGHVHVDVRQAWRIEWVNGRTTSVAMRDGGGARSLRLARNERPRRAAPQMVALADTAPAVEPSNRSSSPNYDLVP